MLRDLFFVAREHASDVRGSARLWLSAYYVFRRLGRGRRASAVSASRSLRNVREIRTHAVDCVNAQRRAAERPS